MLVAIFLIGIGGLLCAEDTTLYRAQWGQDEKGLDGWKVKALDQTGTDPKTGPSITFGPDGAASPLIAVKGGHRLRFRYTFRKMLPGILYLSAKQYAKGNQIAWRELRKFSEPFPDPQPVELGVMTEPEAEQIEFAFGLGGGTAERMTVSGFEVIDLGSSSDAAVDGKELLDDPGWEARARRVRRSRRKIPTESRPGWVGGSRRCWSLHARRTTFTAVNGL